MSKTFFQECYLPTHLWKIAIVNLASKYDPKRYHPWLVFSSTDSSNWWLTLYFNSEKKTFSTSTFPQDLARNYKPLF